MNFNIDDIIIPEIKNILEQKDFEREIYGNNIFLAGGFICDCFLKKNKIRFNFNEKSDIDIYIPIKEDISNFNKNDDESSELKRNKINKLSLLKIKDLDIIMVENFEDERTKKEYDFIYISHKYTDIKDIIDTFDINCTKIGYTYNILTGKGELYITDEFKDFISKKEIILYKFNSLKNLMRCYEKSNKYCAKFDDKLSNSLLFEFKIKENKTRDLLLKYEKKIKPVYSFPLNKYINSIKTKNLKKEKFYNVDQSMVDLIFDSKKFSLDFFEFFVMATNKESKYCINELGLITALMEKWDENKNVFRKIKELKSGFYSPK